MTGAERGFLLLGSKLGNPERKPLSMAQLRILSQRAGNMARPAQDRDLELGDLTALGYGKEMAWRILALLDEEDLLEYYLHRGTKLGCVPITRISRNYPNSLIEKLGPEAPGCIWAKGDLSILNTPMISLVGSRDLLPENRRFAQEVGRQAALQGYTLVSGNARGADKAAQNACWKAGGRVISIVADDLARQPLQERVLYLSEDGYDEAFSAQRALSRNRCIHILGSKVFVAQCGYRQGGTWDGTVKNLRNRWRSVFCFRDGSDGAAELFRLGANPVDREALAELEDLQNEQINLFDR